MTIEQRVQWITLPNGAEPDGTLRLSVFVAPRLRTDEGPTLGTFPDFVDWPARINDAAFTVDIAGGGSVPAAVSGEPADSTLWTALFDAGTPLTPFEFDDFADRPLVSYSVGTVLDTLRTLYSRVAAAGPDDLPRITRPPHVEARSLADLLGETLRPVLGGPLYEGVRGPRDRAERVRRLLSDARDTAAQRRAGPDHGRLDPVEPLPANGSTTREFERALLFHSRAEPEPTDLPEGGAQHAERIDFHQLLSALGDHPWLLRRLGLVVDLTVPAGAIPTATVAAPGELSVTVTWTSALPAGVVDLSPHTAYAQQLVDGETFFAAAPAKPDPAAPPLAPPTGLLPLPDTAFRLEQVDVDGAALKALNLAATVANIAAHPDRPLHEPEQAGVPALRTSGLSLVEAGRATALQAMFAGNLGVNTTVEQGVAPTLHAEDLVRGYRLDVLDTTTGRWHSLHQRVVTAAAERFAGALPPVTDEGLFQLSLAGALTAPGQQPDPNGELYVHENLVSWDGWSLSAARPGKAVNRDPAAVDGAPTRVANDPYTAMGLRLDADAAPGTLPRLRFGRGYRVRVRTVDLAGNGPTLAEADHRLASPAMTTPALPAADALPYLRFEPLAGPALVPTAPYAEGSSARRLVIRSNAGQDPDAYAADHPPYTGYDDRHVAAPKAAFELVERHGLLDPVLGSDGTPPSAAQLAAIAGAYQVASREKGGLAELHPEDQLELPYLPDPLAAGALLFGLPGMPAGQPFEVRFDADDWYRARPFRFRLADGFGPPEWDPASRVLTVRLAQASTATIRICSLLGGDLGLFGLLRWCEQTLAGAELDAVIRAAKENRSWLITPWHEVTLVHAVQQPLAEPDWVEFSVRRGSGQTSADLLGLATVDVASTEQVDLAASWSEWVDDPAEPEPVVRSYRAAVFDLPLAVAKLGNPNVSPDETPCSLRDGKLLTFNTARAEMNTPPAPTRHHFADTHYRRVTYELTASTPFREYFPPEWADRPELLSRTSAPRPVDVPSTAPPTPPRLRYVIPTQGFDTRADGEATVRRRLGGGLRIYLDRPWFSSGDGELLGVVVGGAVTTPSSEDYRYITLLGQDPVRGGKPLEFASPSNFRDAAVVAPGVRLLELAQQVTVVGYAPEFDRATGRWYCDVTLDTAQAYQPFVRLALVRYQPHALSDAVVSRVVLADIAQPLPDRTLTVTPDGTTLRITVAGVSYTAIRDAVAVRADDAALATMTARLDVRDPTVSDDLLAWQPIDGTESTLDRSLNEAVATWTGVLTVPLADGAPRRLVVTEQDHLATDSGTLASRVIYADELPI